MLDEEFLKQYPVSVYHGIRHHDESVVAAFTNLLVSEEMYAVTEKGLHRGITLALEHQCRCPQDNRNAIELQVKKGALWDVQKEKLRCGLPLDTPRPIGREFLTVLSCVCEPA